MTRQAGRIHFADIRRSPRLQRVHQMLSDGLWHSTREIQVFADVCNPNTCKAELIANGCEIECEQRGRYFYYRMTKGLECMKQSGGEMRDVA